MRPARLYLAAVLITAALLRFWGIGHGIPFALDAGEPEIIERAVRMMRTGDLHPHLFAWPTLYLYVQFLVASVGFLVRAALGGSSSLGTVPAAEFYAWGRVVTAVLGLLTVYVVYQIGLRWGARHALLAAALLAVVPYHVRASHYVVTDVPLTFLMTLAFLLTLRALERGTARSFAAAGAVAGLAAATEYYGAVSLLLPLAAAFTSRSGDLSRRRAALTAAGTAVTAFLVAAPFTVLDLPGFLDGFASVIAPGDPARSWWAGWPPTLAYLRGGLGWPGLLLAVAGFGLGVVRGFKGPGQARFSLAVLLLAAYLSVIAFRDAISARDLLPIFPIACVLAAVAVVSGVSLLRRFNIPRWARTTLIVALTVAALLPPAVASIQWVRTVTRGPVQAAVR